MAKRKKTGQPSFRAFCAELEAKGVTFSSVGVNTVELNTRAVGASIPDALVTVTGDAPSAKTTTCHDVDWRKLPPAFWVGMGEDEWMRALVAKARFLGWETYHTRDSRGSDEGFPDVVFAKEPRFNGVYAGRVFYAELKDEDGEQTEAQKKWQRLLQAGGNDCFLWRPSDWHKVLRILEGTLVR